MKTSAVFVFLVAELGTGFLSTRAHAQPAEVTVRGASEGRRLQQSAEAVSVVGMDRAKKQSADLGEIMTRVPGVAVLRMGGLGSQTRFTLNGLSDDQIRFFVDGVPLDVAGYPFGLANVPVNLIDRVEIYRGVVPLRFGADALGGAVNLVTDPRTTTGGSASYQIGSFGNYRFALSARYRHEPSGFLARANAFFDIAKNNYPVDAFVSHPDGTSSPATVTRFHDGYLANGVSLEVGFVDRPWAKRLLLRGFTTGYDKDLQNDAIMRMPYGEVTYGERVHGATLRYEQPLRKNVDLDVIANYTHRTIDFTDASKWVYNWLGQRINERAGAPGEIEPNPTDQMWWQHSAFGRALLAWTVTPGHTLRVNTTPSYTTRIGEERLLRLGHPDVLAARQNLFSAVSGVEYELNAFPRAQGKKADSDHRLQNIVFVKSYIYGADADKIRPDGTRLPQDRSLQSFGVGDSVRLRLTDSLYAKASYEYATRLPRPDEVFGNGVLVRANLELQPETSHNGNIGPRLELRRSAIGDLTVDINAFLRASDQMIRLFGATRYLTYQNVQKTRALGVEGSFSWTLPGRWLIFDGSGTYQDIRNVSSAGGYVSFNGDRVPTLPWLFASWGARVRFERVFRNDDQLEPFYLGRYVHEFYRFWETGGIRESKQTVDMQLTHGLGVTYSMNPDFARMAATFEVQNLTDARVYDFYGVQRPGRAFFVKMTAEM